MKRHELALCILISIAAALTGPPTAGASVPGVDFERLKALEGTWEALDQKGAVIARVTYEPVAGGSSLLERIDPSGPGDPGMISVYHMDGNDLVMTHYCGAGNQPTMKAAPGSAQIVFRMTSATNLAKPTDGHMHGLKVTFRDQDHFTQEWTWTAAGKEMPHVFNYVRAGK